LEVIAPAQHRKLGFPAALIDVDGEFPT